MALQTIYLGFYEHGPDSVFRSVLSPLSITHNQSASVLPKRVSNSSIPDLTGDAILIYRYCTRNLFIAFFSNSDTCNDGTIFGFVPNGFTECNQNLTILGHPNNTFTGLQAPDDQCYSSSLPMSVSDDGVPALECAAAENPPSNPSPITSGCIQDGRGPYVGVLEYRS